MAGEVSAQAEALSRAAKYVGEARADLDKQCDEIRDQLYGLKDYWHGAAAGAFNELYQQWEDKTRTTIAVLDDFEHKLRAIDRAHHRADQAAADSQKRLGARLG
jgi:WXG100 family type VII secretion target